MGQDDKSWEDLGLRENTSLFPMAYGHWIWLGPQESVDLLLILFSLILAVPSSPMKRWNQQIRPLLRLGLPRSVLPIPTAISMFLFKILGARRK